MLWKITKLLLMISGALLWLMVAFMLLTRLAPPAVYSYSIDLAGTKPQAVQSIGCGGLVQGHIGQTTAEGQEVATCEGGMFVLVRYADHDAICNVGYVDHALHMRFHTRFRIEGGLCKSL